MYYLPYLLLYRVHRAALDARRQDRTWRFVAYSIAAGVMAAGALAISLAFTYLCFYYGIWWAGAITFGLTAMPLLAPPLLRHVVVPLGQVRLARYCAYIARPGPDAEGFALVAAAWAFLHKPHPAAEAYVLALREARKPLGDCEVIASAFVAAGHGDADTARALLQSVPMLVEDHPPARELAGEWLAVDAAERGAWHEVFQLGAVPAFPASPLTLLIEGVADRQLEPEHAPGVAEMIARWLVAPQRRATWALLQQRPVTTAPPGAATPISAASAGAAVSAVPAFPRAIAAHLQFASTTPSATTFAATVAAWDAALVDGAMQAWLARRAVELEAPLGAVDRALRDVVSVVTAELGAAADAARLGSPASRGPLGDSLGRRLRHGRLDALETGFTRWRERRDASVRRKDASATRPAIDEWREFLALKSAYEAAVGAGGLDLRRLAFPHAFSTGTSVAAWLWNDFDEYALSHAISTWLLAEAMIVGDAQAIELGTSNCRLTVHTRLGPVEGSATRR